MSRVGKQHIGIPAKTEVLVNSNALTVKGPLGELHRMLRPEVTVAVMGDHVKVEPRGNSKFARSMWGTTASHIINMIAGVNKAFEKQLLVEGVGFKSEVSNNVLVMSLGFSHQVKIPVPADLKVTAEKNVITISGSDKESVGRFAAYVRDHKKPEPYKGKGIRYRTEVIRRKEGKKSA